MTAQFGESISSAVDYARANEGSFIEQFKEVLRIPSIGADPAYREGVRQTADWLVDEMSRLGFSNCQTLPSQGHPVAYGEWLKAGDDKPTVLVYAHYDVQPVVPLELWESPPFEPEIRDGKLYARGVIDNKCGAFINLKVFESILETTGSLPVNIKVFFEGEEESGSPSMEALIAQHRDLLAADLLICSDGGNLPDQPKCLASTRGIVTGEVTVRGPKRDLHSGSYGGFVHNPGHLVGKIIAAFHDDQGRIQLPGYYDDVKDLTPVMREQLRQSEPVLLPNFKERSGVNEFWGVPEYSIMERATGRPTLDVNGITCGYQGEGGMTIIPAQASFKVSMRLVADQDPAEMARKLEEFVMSFACPSLDIEVEVFAKGWAAELLQEGPEIEALQKAFRTTWGQEAMLDREGGTVPILGMFYRELGMPMIQFGYGVGDNGHAPNEYFDLDFFTKGIETGIHFYHYLAEDRT